MNFRIIITASKLMAFVICFCALALDLTGKNSTAFMFAVPFVSALIVGKQYFDSKNGTEKPTK